MFPNRSASTALLAAAALVAVATGCGSGGGADTAPGGAGSTIQFGVSAPLTGPLAEYGGYYKRGFGLALDELNAAGGVNGRKIELQWQDSQSDPKQSVPVAQKLVSDERVIAELGDFSSTASMAASPIYQRNKLVQYGFTNSSPLFTTGGDHMWSPSVSQDVAEVQQTDAVAKYGKKIAVLYLNTSWGQSVYDVFTKEAAKLGLQVTYSASYLPSTTDFRPLLINARDSKPDVVYDIGYDNDAAAILNQAPAVGVTSKIFLEQLTPVGIKLAGANAEGALTTLAWSASSPDPAAQKFTTAFKAKYGELPGLFDVFAYDALTQLAHAVRKGGATRQGVYNGLKDSTDLPSVQYGAFRFEADRRPQAPPAPPTVVVQGGAQVPVTGQN